MIDPAAEDALVARLRAGDGLAFRELVGAYQTVLLRLADTFVPSRAVAEEVVQETWIAVIQGIDRFEGRSSLKTWIVRILMNIARTRGVRERRTVPISSLDALSGVGGPVVSIDRFVGPPGRGAWAWPPAAWAELPEDCVTSAETKSLVVKTISALPEQQRRVVMLRDVEDCSASDVCDLLGLSEVNQRVLLHRGRSTVRAALERHFGEQR
ncbi:MAG: sigma-70 family RNA polymerase sigma factor [Acidimicrobiales bacterium]